MRFATMSALAIALAAPLPVAATAQDYPSRTVTVVVPFPAGGSVDGVARILVQKLNETVGQHFIVENRAGGASGIVGANAVAKAAPDGYTLMVSSSVQVINPFLYKSVPYDVVHDFTPVTLLAEGPLIVSTTPSIPANNLKDFFALVRKDPQKYTFGGTSLGSAGHLAIELLKHDAGLDTLVITYKGTAPALTDLMSGQIQLLADALLAAAGAGRQDQGARPHQPQACGRGARDSDRGGVRRERLRIRILVRTVGTEGPAGRSFQQAAGGDRQSAGAAGREHALGFEPIGSDGKSSRPTSARKWRNTRKSSTTQRSKSSE